MFYTLHERFFDISTFDTPSLADAACKPWTLFHQVQGCTWVDEGLLSRLGVNTAQTTARPRFIAITDQDDFFIHAECNQGKCRQIPSSST